MNVFGLVSDARIRPIKRQPRQRHDYKDEHAAFRPDRAAREPTRAVEGRAHQMPGDRPAAVGHGVQIAFAPVPRSVKADGEPQVSGTAKCQAEKKSDDRNREQTHPGFPGIANMQSCEESRKQHRSGPETDALGQRELRIATQQEFFEQADDDKKPAPENRKFQDAPAMQCEPAEGKIAKAAYGKHQNRNGNDAPGHSYPECFSKGTSPWQAVAAERTLLNRPHHQRGQKGRCKKLQLPNQVLPNPAHSVRLKMWYEGPEQNEEHPPHSNVKQKSPSRSQPLRTDNDCMSRLEQWQLQWIDQCGVGPSELRFQGDSICSRRALFYFIHGGSFPNRPRTW